jgi:Lipid A 3-O-deacylase (PagL)
MLSGPDVPVPRRTWSVFTEYSPNSSHIFLGEAGNRKFVTVGGSFTQRLYRGRNWNLAYLFEIRPLMAESDPVVTGFSATLPGTEVPPLSYHYPHEYPVLSPGPATQTITFIEDGTTYTEVVTTDYGRRWTYVGGMSPIGFQANLRQHARLQPVLMLNGGFAVSPRDIPMFDSSAANFTFAFGAGFEWILASGHAIRVEYRIHHLSNADTGAINPGIDSQTLHVDYVWGRP